MNTNLLFEARPALLIDICEKHRTYDYRIIDLNTWLFTVEESRTGFTAEVIEKLKNFQSDLPRKIRVI